MAAGKNMDKAIWAIFYDLPAKGREAYLEWFHGVHILEKLARPGYRWAAHYEAVHPGKAFEKVFGRLGREEDPALASGAGFIALFGGETTRTFFDPSPAQLKEGQSAETREMVSRRVKPLGLIYCEEWRAEGPDAGAREGADILSPAIQMGRYDARGNDEDLQTWYAQERMAGVERTSGCVGARKLLASSGSPRHSVLYEYVSLEAREENYASLEETEWTHRVHGYLLHPPGSPLVGSRIWPPIKI